ncbi:MAG: hypothetical protein M3P93_16325 [Actinomycetota bacterium]|nr:hypothetical protein [Actinomycetota bacterium]
MFLTAVHCGDALDHYNGNTSGRGLVTFAAEFVPGESETVPGTLVRHPSWTSVSSSNLARNDVAVVLLDRPVDDIVPRPAGPRPRARPRPARADVPHGRLRLRGARHRAGPHRHQPARQADSSFQSLTRDFLRLSQVQAAGDEGVCLGDSGGPQSTRPACRSASPRRRTACARRTAATSGSTCPRCATSSTTT